MLRTLHIILILSLITITTCVWNCNDGDPTTPNPQDKLQFINTTNCDVFVQWNQIGTYNYETPTKENVNILIGTDFKIPEKEQNGQKFVTRQEAIEGLSARYKIKSYASRILDPSGFDSFSNIDRTDMQVDVGTTDVPLRSYLLQKINTCTGPGHEYKTYTDEIYAIDIPVVSCKPGKHYLKKFSIGRKLENVKGKTEYGKKIIKYESGVYWPAIDKAKSVGVNLDNSIVDIGFLTGELVNNLGALESLEGIPFGWEYFNPRVVKTVKTESTLPLWSSPNSYNEIYQLMGECGEFKIYTSTTLVKTIGPHISYCRFNNNVKIKCPPEEEIPEFDKCQFEEYFRIFSIGAQHEFIKHDRTSKLLVKFPHGVRWSGMSYINERLYRLKNIHEILYERVSRLGVSKTGFNLSTIARDDFRMIGYNDGFKQNFTLDDNSVQFYQHIVKCDDYVIQTSNVWKKVANCKDGSTGPFVKCDFVPNMLLFEDDE